MTNDGNTKAPHLETLTQWLNASQESRKQEVQRCLELIREKDPQIHAWVCVQPEEATGHGPLSGIPFGVKDVIETAGLPTEYGSPLYKGHVANADAAIVKELRHRGGIVLGKTQTTAFSYRKPAPTRNPRNLEHTPGGSSSGSAAAVAAGMVPFTIGEQTVGSVLRPASYCGVTGFKPTHGLLSMEGVLPLAKSFDTLGFFTTTPADMLALWEAMGRSTGKDENFTFGVVEPVPDIDPSMQEGFHRSLMILRSAGVAFKSADISALLAKVFDAAQTVLFYEAARFHEARFRQYGSKLDDLADLIQSGLKISEATYEDAQKFIAESRVRFTEFFKDTPVILSPAATGPAPLGLGWTGDARMNAPWTALGTPAISIPMPVASDLPLGLQLTAEHRDDARLLRAAVRLSGILAAQGTSTS